MNETNFEKALATIDTLSRHNQELMDKIEALEHKLSRKVEEDMDLKIEDNYRVNEISKGADEAIKRYKKYLRKEFPSAKSKQSQRQSV